MVPLPFAPPLSGSVSLGNGRKSTVYWVLTRVYSSFLENRAPVLQHTAPWWAPKLSLQEAIPLWYGASCFRVRAGTAGPVNSTGTRPLPHHLLPHCLQRGTLCFPASRLELKHQLILVPETAAFTQGLRHQLSWGSSLPTTGCRSSQPHNHTSQSLRIIKQMCRWEGDR